VGRIALREGALEDEPGVLRLDPVSTDPASEDAFRAAFAAALAQASAQRATVVALAPAGTPSLPLQRRAEILLDEARRHFAGATSIEEIRFVIEGEPSFRVFESVQDAARIAEQMERLRRREP
jgi:O-acetyl-ADP-ribose deacetylase (regulator of RNase III)